MVYLWRLLYLWAREEIWIQNNPSESFHQKVTFHFIYLKEQNTVCGFSTSWLTPSYPYCISVDLRKEIKALTLGRARLDLNSLIQVPCVFCSLSICCMSLNQCLTEGCLVTIFLSVNLYACLSVCLSLTKGFILNLLNITENITWDVLREMTNLEQNFTRG